MLPVLAVGLWAFVAVVAGSAYPWFIQRFRVEPAESSREAPYIERNIAATRAAYGLERGRAPRSSPPPNRSRPRSSPRQAARDNVRNLRLLDPEIVDDTFQRRQADLGWLRFPEELDVDRYMIDGQVTQVVVGARELNPANLPQKSWESQRLIYTHGYGVAMAPANEVPDNEEASFLVGGLPVEVNDRVGVDLDRRAGPALLLREPVRLRHGQHGQAGDRLPDRSTDYQGETGVGIGSYLRRAAFALRFQDINPLISGSIGDDSRILFVRGVQERLQKVAPFLHFDADPYPVVLDGRVVYLVDAYTTSDRYPYAERVPSSGLPAASGLRHSFNYVRNSVKAVVDAYDGSVQLYVVPGPDGAIDPIARAYEKAFPRLFQPLEEMPERCDPPAAPRGPVPGADRRMENAV